ncbi:MAG TPA: hypothetical protein VFF30_03420 [Nitrososphaerales archaeon]|nr:hypothetical protein [Nitrososphaerales archaeon]
MVFHSLFDIATNLGGSTHHTANNTTKTFANIVFVIDSTIREHICV